MDALTLKGLSHLDKKMKIVMSKKLLLPVFSALLMAFLALALFRSLKEQGDYIAPRRGSISEAVYGLGKVKTHNRFEVKVVAAHQDHAGVCK